MQQLKPAEILEVTIQSGVNRAAYSFRQLIMLGFLAGAFISLAGAGANMAGFYFLADPATSGIGRMISGIIFLVCLAVWIANGADSTIGKIFGIFFPILLFVTAGFEHSVANMFSIPIGIFADSGATAGLTWTAFLVNNLLPVTLGNIAGGGFFVTGTYYLAYKRYEKA